MKKVCFLGIAMIALLLSACGGENDSYNSTESAPGKEYIAYIGDQVKAYSNGNLLNATRAADNGDHPSATFESQNFHWEDPFNVRKAMPESNKQKCLEYASLQDYCYVANGEAFDLVALYGAASYNHKVIMHYQIDGQEYQHEVFNDIPYTPECETCGGKGYIGKAWNDPDRYDCEDCNGNGVWPMPTVWFDFVHNRKGPENGISTTTMMTSRMSDEAPAMKIKLPAGTVFYFECISCDQQGNPKEIYYNNVKIGYHDYYTIASKNVNETKQSVTFALNEWTLIGFEDNYYENSDKDFNDVIIAVNPVQYVAPEPVVGNDGDVTPGDIYKPAGNTTDKNGNVVSDPTKPQENTTMEDIVNGNDDSANPANSLDASFVETNWAVNEQTNEKGDVTRYSKVSIHIRDTTDIEVVIPIASAYCCPADDFYIVATHQDEMVYGKENTVTYTIGDNSVVLTITHNEDNITITSDGINADVLKYLQDKYGDGITFEVWTWLGTMPTIENGTATIEFLDSKPKYYLNRMNSDNESNDYEFATPDGYGAPTAVSFHEGNYQYSTQVYTLDE